MTNATIIGLKDLRENTEEYIEKIKLGREFTVVRKSKPIFKIVPVDQWGDEGIWETVANFKELGENGVSAKTALRSLRKNNGSHR